MRQRHKYPVRTAAVLATAVAVAGWLGPGTGSAAQPSARPSLSLAQRNLALTLGSTRPASLTMPANGRTPAAAEATALGAQLGRRFAAVYGGDAVTDHGRAVTVYLTGGASTAARVTAALGTARDRWPVRYARTGQTLAAMQALQGRITRDLPRLGQLGVRLVSWGPDVWTGRELLRVYQLNAAKAALLQARYGRDRVLLERSAVPAVSATSTSRIDDLAPFNGGDFATGRAGGVNADCTTGWGMHSAAGTDYLLTAGHCWKTGTTVHNDSHLLTVAGYPTGPDARLGNVSNRDTTASGLDIELIKVSSSAAVFTGTVSDPAVVDDSGPISSPYGVQVCSDGAFEGEVCGLIVQQTGQCITLTETPPPTTRVVCGENYATLANGQAANGDGDSGSGVLRFNVALAKAAGIDSGGSIPATCVNYPKTSRQCYSDLYYVAMPTLLKDKHLGVTGLKLNT